jgi:hypothetical protein
MTEMELSPQDAVKRPLPDGVDIRNIPDSTSISSMKAVIAMAPLVLDGPCYFKVRIVTE